MTGPQRDAAAARAGRPGPPLDALAGPDGTQDPAPPPPFPDALSGLLTGDLLPRQRLTPGPPPTPDVPVLDPDAVARAAEQLVRAPVRRRSNQPRSAQSPRPPVATPRQPRAIAPARSGAARPPGQRRMSPGAWLILLFVLAVLAYNLLRSVLGNLPIGPH